MYNEINEIIDVRFWGELIYDVAHNTKQIGDDVPSIPARQFFGQSHISPKSHFHPLFFISSV